MVRRRIAAGAAVVLLIIIVLIINGCLKSQKQQSLKDYNHAVSEIARESDSQVSKPFFRFSAYMVEHLKQFSSR